jgi:UDP-N-acetylmuramoyl-tripeptide--D-alanyl-D-alanine ligase
LLELGAWGRAKLDQNLGLRIVGVTGSVGKTSTKDLVASALSVGFKTHANERSFNNDFGLPTTILNAPDETQALVLEMGMRGFGEIAKLCAVAHPQIGVVTAVAKAHTERVGSIDGVAIAKRELIEALPKAGIAILNRDDERVWEMRRSTDATVFSFGTSEHADVRMTKCTIDDRGCATASVASPWGQVELMMQVAGRHMAQNALAALCVAGALGIDLGAAAAAVSAAKISDSRMQMRKLQSGATVIDDSYNANPASMRAALETLASLNAKRKVAFCGLMAELAESASEHRSIRQYATELGIEFVAVNTDLYDVDAVSFDQARDQLAKLGRDDAALVKGSKVTGLVRLCEGL